MGDKTGISWTDKTFNPWWGCARVSPACVRCYAEAQAKRYGHEVWRRHGPRRMLSEANWAKPLKCRALSGW
jgi:protein gp37